jgi:hypothetical protein
MKKYKKPIQIMRAPDMFNPEIKQKFNVKTGVRISYGHQEFNFDEPEQQEIQEPISKDQLTLFI